MALSHVCEYSNEKEDFIPISAEEAVKKYPDGVEASSKIFWCMSCQKSVTLVVGEHNQPHFKHSVKDRLDNCPDKIRGYDNSQHTKFKAGEYNLPIKIEFDAEKKEFHFLLGIPISDEMDKIPKDWKVVIENSSGYARDYSFERLLQEKYITYVDVGRALTENYNISVLELKNGKYKNKKDILKNLLPKKVSGVLRYGDNNVGVLFDYNSKKMIPRDADISPDREYLFLTTDRLYDVKHKCSYTKEILYESHNKVSLYHIKPGEITAQSNLYWRKNYYHITKYPVKPVPLWPVCVRLPYRLSFKAGEKVFFLNGKNVSAKMYPEKPQELLPIKHEHKDCKLVVCKRNNNIKQLVTKQKQLVTFGKTYVLKHTYIDENLQCDSSVCDYVTIYDSNNHLIKLDNGIYEASKNESYFSVKGCFDGFIEIIRENRSIEIKDLCAGVVQHLNSIKYFEKVRVYQGLDLVLEFEVRKKNRLFNQKDILIKLERFSGDEIVFSNRYGGVLKEYREYPDIIRWILMKKRSGRISKRALMYLVDYRRGMQNV